MTAALSSSGRAAMKAVRGRMTSRSAPTTPAGSPITNRGWGDRPAYSRTTATGRPRSSATPQRVRAELAIVQVAQGVRGEQPVRIEELPEQLPVAGLADLEARAERRTRAREGGHQSALASCGPSSAGGGTAACGMTRRASRSVSAPRRPSPSVGDRTPISVTMALMRRAGMTSAPGL